MILMQAKISLNPAFLTPLEFIYARLVLLIEVTVFDISGVSLGEIGTSNGDHYFMFVLSKSAHL